MTVKDQKPVIPPDRGDRPGHRTGRQPPSDLLADESLERPTVEGFGRQSKFSRILREPGEVA